MQRKSHHKNYTKSLYMSWLWLQHLFSRAERKHACLHIYLQYEIKTYRPYSRYRVTRLCSDSLCIFPCNETHLLLKEKYCKMLKGKIRAPSKYRIILFEDLRNLLIMLNLKISIPVTNNATKFLKIQSDKFKFCMRKTVM